MGDLHPTVIIKDESLRQLGGFTQVPNVVLTHPKLSGNAKITYGVLLSYAWQKDFCWPAQERLAQDTNCSVRTVQRYLTELEQQGLIRVRRQGLNRPNVYEILPISSWHSGPKSPKDKDTTDLSHPDTTQLAHPDTTGASPQETTSSSYKEDSGKQTHRVVNALTANDHKPSLKDEHRQTATTISDRALRATYQLTDQQIAQVHYLVDKQADVLKAVERNHAYYVKRAAEAVVAGDGQLLDTKLSDFKQAATAITVANAPAYFERMWKEAREKQSRPAADLIPPPPPAAAVPNEDAERIARLFENAAARGFSIPENIRRSSDYPTVARWWAALPDRDEVTHKER
jgi:hypothetical protein